MSDLRCQWCGRGRDCACASMPMTSTQIAGLYAIRGLTHGYGRAPTRSELCEHMATYLRASRGTVNRVLDALARRRRIRMNGNSIELLIDGGSP